MASVKQKKMPESLIQARHVLNEAHRFVTIEVKKAHKEGFSIKELANFFMVPEEMIKNRLKGTAE